MTEYNAVYPTNSSEANALLEFVPLPATDGKYEQAEKDARGHLDDYSEHELYSLLASLDALIAVVKEMLREK